MLEPERRRSGVSVIEAGVIAVTAVVGIIVAFWVLSAIAGIVWFAVKLAVLVFVVGLIVSFLMRRR